MRNTITSLSNRVQRFISAPGYRPLTRHQLAAALNLHDTDCRALRRVLKEMEREGVLVRLRKNRWAEPSAAQCVAGDLTVHPAGFGFVLTGVSAYGDLFIPRVNRYAVLDGDRVLVEATKAAGRSEGRIVRVLRRRRETLSGTLLRTRYYAYVVPDHPRLLPSVRLRAVPAALCGDARPRKVVVKLDPWDEIRKPLTGQVIEDLGPAGAEGVDMLAILRDHGLEERFSPASEREAEGLSPPVDGAQASGRLDLRAHTVITIDPEKAGDFDDALSLERLPDGNRRLGVHIADVAFYVPEDSAIDREARMRGNSVYLADRAVPMLPRRLTSEICSLVEGRDRLAHSVMLTLDREGVLRKVRVARSIIRSSARLTYTQVQSWMNGETSDRVLCEKTVDLLAALRSLARTLRLRRQSRGALTYSLPEVRCILDGKGHIEGFRRRTESEAYALVEECMLAANTAVAGLLSQRGYPLIHRVHPRPTPEQWARMTVELRGMGLPDAPTCAADLVRLAQTLRGDERSYPAALCVLRNLPRAEYSAHRDEHFGLAESSYTHFTSPIRRYADLAVHRLLIAAMEGRPPPYPSSALAELAAWCTDRERNAEEAEEESLTVKRMAYFDQALRRGDSGPYAALVVSFNARGLVMEVEASLQKGLLPFGRLCRERVILNRERTLARAARSGMTWRMGDRLSVSVDRVDTARRRIEFRCDPLPFPARRGRHRTM